MARAPRPQKVHWLPTNERCWSPRDVAVWDSETVDTGETPSGGRVLSLVTWSAVHIDRRGSSSETPTGSWAQGTMGAELAEWMDARARRCRTLWAMAHNLAFDVTTTRLLDHLIRIGWTLGEFSLSDAAPWARLSKGRAVITLADTWGWLPASLDDVAAMSGQVRPGLPEDDADRDGFAERCSADVRITADAIVSLMDWWDERGLGNWGITGASCGFSAMRHRTPARAFLVDPDPELRARSRAAIYGGRREVTRTGDLVDGPYTTLDLRSAYLTVARTCALPSRFGVRRQVMSPTAYELGNPYLGVIADALIRTEVARYPCRIGGNVFHPVGEFWTRLAGPEIIAARDRGDLVALRDADVWVRSLALRSWASWCQSVADGEDDGAPAVARLAARSWGRSVIGKFAGHSPRVTEIPQRPEPGWHIEPGWDLASNTRASLVTIAERSWAVTHDLESDNAIPAVFAWVESETRVRLSAMLDVLGEDRWIQCDTDGVLVGDDELGRLENLAAASAPLEPRPKERFERLEIRGPQHMVLDGKLHMSGVPRGARRTGDDTWQGRIWPKLAWQMAHTPTSGYVRDFRTWRIGTALVHRWIAADGRALPVQARVGARGVTEIVSWPETRWAAAGVELAADQWAGLAGYR